MLLQRSWPCSRYRPQPTALPRAREMHSQVSDDGNILPRCIPKRPRTGKGPFVATYRRRVFKMSWLWQDVRAMYPKSPANRRRRIHRAKILLGRGTFRCTGASNHARRAYLAIVRCIRGKDRAENAYVLSKTEPKRQKMSPKVLTSF